MWEMHTKDRETKKSSEFLWSIKIGSLQDLYFIVRLFD